MDCRVAWEHSGSLRCLDARARARFIREKPMYPASMPYVSCASVLLSRSKFMQAGSLCGSRVKTSTPRWSFRVVDDVAPSLEFTETLVNPRRLSSTDYRKDAFS